jgi:membrane-bound lytic murein transglycosylase B
MIFASIAAHGKPIDEKKARKEIVKSLSKSFPKEELEAIFLGDERLALIGNLKTELLKTESIDCGIDYWNKYDLKLKEAEYLHGVEPEYILAILRIETNFGENTGKYKAINALYSMYVLRPDRRDFAKKELEAFLRFAKISNRNVFDIKSSSAGAMGIAQFMPSSYFSYGTDGNNDGEVDLWSHEDAIMSVARYLSGEGWGKNRKEQEKAILAYNRDRAYVDAVIAYAEALREEKNSITAPQ